MSPPSLDRNRIRAVLAEKLPTESDLDAFCLDFFPNVYTRFAQGMNRIEKTNLLLQVVPNLSEILKRLPDASSAAQSPSVHRFSGRAVILIALVIAAITSSVLFFLMGRARREDPLAGRLTPKSAASAAPSTSPPPPGINADNQIVSSPGAQMHNRAAAPAKDATAQPLNSGNRIEGSAGARMTNEVDRR